MGKAWVYYVPPNHQGIRNWIKLVRETPHDLLYLNSFFNPVFAIVPLIVHKWFINSSKRVIVAPRGEFSPGALALKYWKKGPILHLLRLLGLYRSVVLQASSLEEAEYICNKLIGKSNNVFCKNSTTMVAIDMPQQPAAFTIDQIRVTSQFLKIIFLSRISRKKNLDYALKVLSRLQIPVQFDIWGVIEDNVYWTECQSLITVLPENVKVNYMGVADNTHINQIFSMYDLFFFPTRGENYGHVIAESISVGTPVLISDQTPWRNLDAEGVGWDLPLYADNDFIKAIRTTYERVISDREGWRRQVYNYAVRKLNNQEILEANRNLFSSCINS